MHRVAKRNDGGCERTAHEAHRSKKCRCRAGLLAFAFECHGGGGSEGEAHKHQQRAKHCLVGPESQIKEKHHGFEHAQHHHAHATHFHATGCLFEFGSTTCANGDKHTVDRKRQTRLHVVGIAIVAKNAPHRCNVAKENHFGGALVKHIENILLIAHHGAIKAESGEERATCAATVGQRLAQMIGAYRHQQSHGGKHIKHALPARKVSHRATCHRCHNRCDAVDGASDGYHRHQLVALEIVGGNGA